MLFDVVFGLRQVFVATGGEFTLAVVTMTLMFITAIRFVPQTALHYYLVDSCGVAAVAFFTPNVILIQIWQKIIVARASHTCPPFWLNAAIFSEKDAELAQTLGKLQPFLAVLPQECTGQLAHFGAAEHLSRLYDSIAISGSR